MDDNLKNFLNCLLAGVETKLGSHSPMRLARLVDGLGGVLVLMCHSVVTPDSSHKLFTDWPCSLSAEAFRKLVRLTSRYFDPISYNDLEDHVLAGSRLPERSCLLVLDDGWRDNHSVVWPVLKDLGIPAHIFLSTGLVGQTELYWTLQLWLLLMDRADRPNPELDELLAILGGEPDRLYRRYLDHPSQSQRAHLTGSVTKALSGIAHSRRTAWLTAMKGSCARLGLAEAIPRPYLSWDEVREMESSLITFGCHSQSHLPLTWLPDKDLKVELGGAKRTIEAELGHQVRSFSYPHSLCSDREEKAVRQAGFDLVFKGSDPGRDLSGRWNTFTRLWLMERDFRPPLASLSEPYILHNLLRRAPETSVQPRARMGVTYA